jgi:hypothetical protein
VSSVEGCVSGGVLGIIVRMRHLVLFRAGPVDSAWSSTWKAGFAP